MPLKREQFLSRLRSPYPGRVVVTSRNDALAVRGEGCRKYACGMPVQGSGCLAGAHVPQFGRAVATCGEEPPAVWREGDRVNRAFMSFERDGVEMCESVPVIPLEALEPVAL